MVVDSLVSIPAFYCSNKTSLENSTVQRCTWFLVYQRVWQILPVWLVHHRPPTVIPYHESYCNCTEDCRPRPAIDTQMIFRIPHLCIYVIVIVHCFEYCFCGISFNLSACINSVFLPPWKHHHNISSPFKTGIVSSLLAIGFVFIGLHYYWPAMKLVFHSFNYLCGT